MLSLIRKEFPMNRQSVSRLGRQFPPHAARLLAFLLPALAVGCSQGSPERSNRRAVPANFVKGSFVITAESSTSEDKLKSLTDSVGSELGCAVKKPERINWGDSAKAASGVLSEELQNTFNVRYENCDLSREGTEAILAKLSGDASVTSAEAEAVASVAPIQEDDDYKSSQGHLGLIKRDEACALAGKKGDKPVIIAIVDSGVDRDHPDLQDMFLRDAQGRVVGANFVGSGASFPADENWDDQEGHGTHVAGLAAAAANNGQGVVGVASCANVKIMPVRVLNDKGSGSSIEIDRGVKWAADRGADIINMSLGYVATYSFTPSFRHALYSNLAAQDVLIFAAAGNDGMINGSDAEDGSGKMYDFPASYDDVISVAATNNFGNLTSFSNRGFHVDIAAPGSNVLATYKGGDYGRMSGTSMASPVAAGVYALALAAAKPGLTLGAGRVDAKTAGELLLASTVDGVRLSTSDVAAGGVIDAAKLVAAMQAKFPVQRPTQPTEPMTPDDGTIDQPTQPNDGTVTEPTQPARPAQPAQPAQPSKPAKFGFIGLADGAKAAWPQGLKLGNLPKGTRAVYLFWGDSPYSFSRVYVDGKAKQVEDDSNWFFYGTRKLTAIAIDGSWNVIGTSQVMIKGH
jgi:subtilisin family serine protease